ACGGLPGTSGVQPGRRLGENVAPRARIVVSPPIKGASQDVIARDFIRAGAGFQETDENQQVVARAYLAPASVDRWRPATEVTVYDTQTTMAIEHLPSDQIKLTTTAVATIDDTGRYRELPPGTVTSVVFTMTKVGGEWRVQLPENGFGLWINTDDFDRVFAAYRIHYVLPTQLRLVADVRWLPSGARVATALARAQLGPVPDYLRGAADTGLPEGARLAVDAVNVDSRGVATVTLTNSNQTLEPTRRRAMWAQFVATLTQAPGVSAVSLEVQGIGKIPVSNLPSSISALSELGFESAATPVPSVGLRRTKDGVERINPQSLFGGDQVRPPVQPPKGPVALLQVPAAYVDLAQSPDGSDIAAVARSRAELVRWRGTNPITMAPFATELTSPAYDSYGRLWVSGKLLGRSRIWTFDTSTSQATPPVEVAAAWLDGRVVTNLSVSPDSTRVAVLSKLPDDTDHRLDIAGIVRAAGGLPTMLAAPYRQGEPLTRFTDLTWLDSMSLAVLAQETDSEPLRPFQVDLGAGVGLRRVGQEDVRANLIPPVAGAQSITSRGGIRGLIVMTDSAAFVRVAKVWDPLPGVSEIVIAGS
ncbi:MAG: LpqB family beta-propeller domain-containing protein, partial [Actinomycetota bacterium]|nr:LpqB family beta-propeller domain-containing protein [Actinomycetota bacterium]